MQVFLVKPTVFTVPVSARPSKLALINRFVKDPKVQDIDGFKDLPENEPYLALAPSVFIIGPPPNNSCHGPGVIYSDGSNEFNPIVFQKRPELEYAFGLQDKTTGFGSPCFVNIESVNAYAKMAVLAENYRQEAKIKAQDYISLIIRYGCEKLRWWLSGKPERSISNMSAIYDTCSGCTMFEQYEEEEGGCLICGCGLKRRDRNMNKISWATTHCPKRYPEWF